VIGQRGVWVNKAEVEKWRGPVPIEDYEINQDGSPLIVNKKSDQCIQ
jgi:hypothetical protein